jgi:release factor glutamine methyltransferase
MAATNATELGIGPDRVTWKVGSGFAPVAGTFNVILSNPPYIPTAHIADLDPEVSLFDPLAALDGGPDGLDFYRAWSVAARAHADKLLTMIIFEVGHDQARAVVQLLTEAKIALHWQVDVFRDLAHIDRCVALSTRPASV